MFLKNYFSKDIEFIQNKKQFCLEIILLFDNFTSTTVVISLFIYAFFHLMFGFEFCILSLIYLLNCLYSPR